MQRYAFKMFLNPGAAHEYRRRHDAIWPELDGALKDEGRQQLFDLSRSRDQHRCSPISSAPTITAWTSCTHDPVMQRWWAHMKDIMAANPDGSPVTAPLVEMFHLE